MNAALVQHGAKPAASLERHAFYAAAETAYAIAQTGERRFYGNILLTKGVVAPEA
jgi:L-fucose mutarotase